MNWPLCIFAVSRMGCQWLGGMLWQWDIVVALLWMKEVICHSARRRSPNPLCPLSGWRRVALHALPPRRGVTDLPTPSFTCKFCLKISANIMTLWQEQHPMSSCSLSECLVQVRETECSQVHANPATVHPPALTSSGRFEYLWAKNVLLGAKGITQSQTTTALLSHFVAATICYVWVFCFF